MQEYFSIQFLIYQIAAKISSVSAARYRSIGLGLFGVRVLVYLGRYGATTVGELSKGTSIDQPSLSHLLKRMTRDKLVTKRRQPRDNRTVQVRLTPAGSELALKCMEMVSVHERALVAVLKPEEVTILRDVLTRIFDNLGDTPQSSNFRLDVASSEDD